MDASMVAAFVALALLIPLIGVAFAARLLMLMNRFGGKNGKSRKGKGGQAPRRGSLPPLGGNPYHLP